MQLECPFLCSGRHAYDLQASWMAYCTNAVTDHHCCLKGGSGSAFQAAKDRRSTEEEDGGPQPRKVKNTDEN